MVRPCLHVHGAAPRRHHRRASLSITTAKTAQDQSWSVPVYPTSQLCNGIELESEPLLQVIDSLEVKRVN